MVVVHLVGLLAAGNTDFLRIHDYYVVARVHMRRVDRLMFSAQAGRDFAGQAPERFAFRVNHVPLALNSFRFGAIGLHVRCA